MSLPVILDPEARTEFDAAYDWYEERKEGLGESFAEQIQLVLDRIAVTPKLHAVVLGAVRKAVVCRFPYCIYYREEETCIRGLAVFHTSRDPAEWQRRA